MNKHHDAGAAYSDFALRAMFHTSHFTCSPMLLLQVEALPRQIWEKRAALPDMGEAVEEGSSATCYICLVRPAPCGTLRKPALHDSPRRTPLSLTASSADTAERRRTTTWTTCFPSCLAAIASTRRASGRGSFDGALLLATAAYQRRRRRAHARGCGAKQQSSSCADQAVFAILASPPRGTARPHCVQRESRGR